MINGAIWMIAIEIRLKKKGRNFVWISRRNLGRLYGNYDYNILVKGNPDQIGTSQMPIEWYTSVDTWTVPIDKLLVLHGSTKDGFKVSEIK